MAIAWGTIIENVTGAPAGNRITNNAMENSMTGGSADEFFYLGRRISPGGVGTRHHR